MVGKLRHRQFKPPEPTAWRAPATSVPPRPPPQVAPHQPHPCSPGGHCHPPPCSQGSSDVNPNGPGRPWRNKTRQSIPLVSHPPSRVAWRRAGGTPHQSGEQLAAGLPQHPDGQHPAHELPVCAARPGAACARCPRPAAGLGCEAAPTSGYPGEKPEATSAAESIQSGGEPVVPQAGTPRQVPGAGSAFPPQRRGGGEGIACRGKTSPIPSWSWSTSEAAGNRGSGGDGTARARRAAPAILTRPFSFAVPSMPHSGRFPRAAAPALLQTVHSFLDVFYSSPAFLPVPGTHGWYEAMCSGSIGFPAQRRWVSARLSSEGPVANIFRWNRPDVLGTARGERGSSCGGLGHGEGRLGKGEHPHAPRAVPTCGCSSARAVWVQPPKYPLFPH